MLQEDPQRTHVAVSAREVIELYESTNQPLVQPAGRAAQSAQSAVLAVRSGAGYQILVALTLVEAGQNVIYAGEPGIAERAIAEGVEEALVFAESMGFILDSTGWPGLDQQRRSELINRLGAFRPPQIKKDAAPVERVKTQDPLSAVARLFAAFALLLGSTQAACSGPSAEQRARAAEIHYDLGTNYVNDGNAQGALTEYLEAEKNDPELPELQNALGLLYGFSINRPPEAEQHFKRALELKPDFSEAMNNYAAFLMARGRFTEAVPLLEKAIGNPVYAQRATAECNLGWALHKSGQSDRGVARLRGALQTAPRFCKGWRQLGTIFADTNQLEQANDAFAHYAAACPDVADAQLQAGKVLARMSRADEARAAFSKCSAIGKEKDPQSAAECARFLKELGAP